jgi:hypothetical protein
VKSLFNIYTSKNGSVEKSEETEAKDGNCLVQGLGILLKEEDQYRVFGENPVQYA